MDYLDHSACQSFATRAEIPWGALQIGEGYDIVKAQPLPSALNPLTLPANEPPCSFTYDLVTVSNQHDVGTAIGLSSSISASFFKIGIDASTRYLHSVKFSQTSFTTIVRVASTCPPRRYTGKPTLTKEASKVLKQGTDNFLQRYGQYFVSGQVCQSTLFATMTHTAASSEQLNEFKASLTAGYKMTSAEAASECVNRARSRNISTQVHVYIYGYAGPTSVEALDVSENGLAPVLDDFLKNKSKHTPAPHTAQIEDYSWIKDLGIPVPNRDLQVSTVRDQALHKCLALEIQCRSSPLQGMQRLLTQVSTQRQRLISIENNELRSWSQATLSLQVQTDKYVAVQRLLDAASDPLWRPL